MSSSIVSVTVDDFDPLFSYGDPTQWQTPDPQTNPTWYNASSAVTGVPWHEATYHYTTVVGANVTLNFTGLSFTLYGAAAPNATSSMATFGIALDASDPLADVQNMTVQGATPAQRQTLYAADSLDEGAHELFIVNYGGGLLLDLAVMSVQLGADGASLSNSTIDDGSSNITYSGTWTTETGNFEGGTSVYTQGPGNAMAFNFTGSAVYLFGDQVNDHGPYTVSINGTDVATLSGRSGCGVGYSKTCEKLGGLKFFAGDLPAGDHALVLTNNGPSGTNATYFVVTTPSAYADMSASGSPGAGSPSASGSPTSAASSAASSSARTSSARALLPRFQRAVKGTAIASLLTIALRACL